VFFRHLKYTAVENSTIMSVEIEASKPAGISFNVTVVPQLLINNTGMRKICIVHKLVNANGIKQWLCEYRNHGHVFIINVEFYQCRNFQLE